MKKRLFAVLVGMLLCCNIFAQKEPGTLTLYPRVGLNLSKFSGDKIYRESFDYVKSKFKSGLVIGAEMQYQMSFPLAISGGVMFSQQGTSFGEIDGFDDLEISANNINVPLMNASILGWSNRFSPVTIKCSLSPKKMMPIMRHMSFWKLG